ncbi:MAG: alpha/beta fold hydrolase [Pseudomonadales bacterium]|nr:alpha/beta fold hydrolase [Pseudomonadales bacterium]
MSQHTIHSGFTLWGESIWLSDGKSARPHHLQVLTPAQPGAARACLLIVHGMNEHSGRYGAIARHFGERFVVAALDMSAHGLSNPVLLQAHRKISAGSAGHDAGKAYLEQARLRNLQALHEDIERAARYLLTACDATGNGSKLPLFILSHSLGSVVSACWLLQLNDAALKARIAGIIFSGPAFAGSRVPGWRGWFQNPLIRFVFASHALFLKPPAWTLSWRTLPQLMALVTVPLQDALVALLSLPGLRRLFAPRGPAWVKDYLCDNETERKRMNDDQYVIRRNIIAYVLAIIKEIIHFKAQMAHFDTPWLLISSEGDPITPNQGNLDFAALTQSHCADNELLVLRGINHHEQLFSEARLREKILQKMDSWLDARISAHNS